MQVGFGSVQVTFGSVQSDPGGAGRLQVGTSRIRVDAIAQEVRTCYRRDFAVPARFRWPRVEFQGKLTGTPHAPVLRHAGSTTFRRLDRVAARRSDTRPDIQAD